MGYSKSSTKSEVYMIRNYLKIRKISLPGTWAKGRLDHPSPTATDKIICYLSSTPRRPQQPMDCQWLPPPAVPGKSAASAPTEAKDFTGSAGTSENPPSTWWASESTGKFFFSYRQPWWDGESRGKSSPSAWRNLTGSVRTPVKQ